MQIWAESGKSALPICNYSQILYQFLTFTQNLKRSPQVSPSWKPLFSAPHEEPSTTMLFFMQSPHERPSTSLANPQQLWLSKNWLWGTRFEEIEYLAGEFFAIDPYCLVFVFCLSPKVPTGKFIFYRPMKFLEQLFNQLSISKKVSVFLQSHLHT